MAAGGKSTSIVDLTSTVVDNGRRGMPKPGCDCVQCFGYCLIDADKAAREAQAMGGTQRNPAAALDFS
jgi:hypothetical protein